MQSFNTGNEPQSRKKSLAISRQDKNALSKRQKEFNALVRKLETMKEKLATADERLGDHLSYYAKHIHPLEEEVVTLRTACVKKFYGFYADKKVLPKKDRDTLGEIIAVGLEEILNLSPKEPDQEIKDMFEALHGVSLDQVKREGFEQMKGEMEDMFDEMGVDINLGDLHENMTEEEIMKRIMEMKEEYERTADAEREQHANRKKTKKQLAAEEREKQLEEARKKNIGTIYKQLVKAFHPDLEKDDILKLEKEELMKQLTVAYENNDLHTLLKLELNWIQKEESETTKLTDDKLGIYNQVLKEQLEEMEDQLFTLANHPRYQPLHQFASDLLTLNRKQMERGRVELSDKVQGLQADVDALQQKNPLGWIIKLVASVRQQGMVSDFDIEELLAIFSDQPMKGKSKKKGWFPS